MNSNTKFQYEPQLLELELDLQDEYEPGLVLQLNKSNNNNSSSSSSSSINSTNIPIANNELINLSKLPTDNPIFQSESESPQYQSLLQELQESNNTIEKLAADNKQLQSLNNTINSKYSAVKTKYSILNKSNLELTNQCSLLELSNNQLKLQLSELDSIALNRSIAITDSNQLVNQLLARINQLEFKLNQLQQKTEAQSHSNHRDLTYKELLERNSELLSCTHSQCGCTIEINRNQFKSHIQSIDSHPHCNSALECYQQLLQQHQPQQPTTVTESTALSAITVRDTTRILSNKRRLSDSELAIEVQDDSIADAADADADAEINPESNQSIQPQSQPQSQSQSQSLLVSDSIGNSNNTAITQSIAVATESINNQLTAIQSIDHSRSNSKSPIQSPLQSNSNKRQRSGNVSKSVNELLPCPHTLCGCTAVINSTILRKHSQTIKYHPNCNSTFNCYLLFDKVPIREKQLNKLTGEIVFRCLHQSCSNNDSKCNYWNSKLKSISLHERNRSIHSKCTANNNYPCYSLFDPLKGESIRSLKPLIQLVTTAATVNQQQQQEQQQLNESAVNIQSRSNSNTVQSVKDSIVNSITESTEAATATAIVPIDNNISVNDSFDSEYRSNENENQYPAAAAVPVPTAADIEKTSLTTAIIQPSISVSTLAVSTSSVVD